MADDASRLQGLNGGKVLSGSGDNQFAAATDNGGQRGRGILIVNDAVIDTYTGTLENTADLAGVTLPQGLYLPGFVETLELTSGVAIVPF